MSQPIRRAAVIGAGVMGSGIAAHFANAGVEVLLLDIVPPGTPAPAGAARNAFAQGGLDKALKDTPAFIGNRIGTYAFLYTMHQMVRDGLTPEDIDNVTGVPMAHPRSATFRTADVVGLDTVAHVADNCYAALTQDEDREVFKLP